MSRQIDAQVAPSPSHPAAGPHSNHVAQPSIPGKLRAAASQPSSPTRNPHAMTRTENQTRPESKLATVRAKIQAHLEELGV